LLHIIIYPSLQELNARISHDENKVPELFSIFQLPLSDRLKITLGVFNKHSYSLEMLANFGDQFKLSHNLGLLRLSTKLECHNTEKD
jgi:hypothetical protein